MSNKVTDTEPLLKVLWPKLKRSTQLSLLHVMQRLANDYTGQVELHCNKGGVRLVRLGQEFRPSDTEMRLGEDNEP